MAISQKQLGNIFRVLDVPANGQINDPADLTIARGFIFNQETPDISVSFPDPSDTATEKLITILNKGSVAIEVQGLLVKPGPAYGLFWDGAVYRSTAVEGVGTVSFTEDSDALEVQGNGEEDDPLTINLKLSAQAGNKLQLLSDGLFFDMAFPGAGTIFWVDSIGGSDTNDGTFIQPFATVSAAMAVAVSGASIAILPGTYSEDIAFKSGVYVFAFGATSYGSDNRVRLVGTHTYGAAIIEGISIHATAGNVPVSFDVDANVKFINCTITRSDVVTNPTVIDFVLDNSGTFDFIDCSIEGDVVVQASQITGFVVNIIRPQSLGTVSVASPEATVNVRDASEIGQIVHTGGSVAFQNIGRVLATAGVSVLSSAPNSAPNNNLSLVDVSLRQANNTYGFFSKTGSCPYVLSGVERGLTGDTETGTKVFARSADDIRATFVPGNYSPLSASIEEHLKAIDLALALSSVEIISEDTNTAEITGNGGLLDPLTVNVKIDPSANNSLVATPDGLLVSNSVIPTGKVWWVDSINGDDTLGTGSLGKAFATINAAITEAEPADVIKILPGNYVEDIDFTDVAKQNIMLEGFGVADAPLVVINGHVLLSGTHTRSKMKNINIVGQNAGQATVSILDCEGRLKWEQVSVSHASGDTEIALAFYGNNKRWYEFLECSFVGTVSIEEDAITQTDPLEITFLRQLDTTPSVVVDSENAKVYLDARKLGSVEHHNGTLTVVNTSMWNVGLLSDSDTGLLTVNNVAMLDSTGAYVDIQKTGTCAYQFSNVVREFDESNVLTGTPLRVLAEDINAAYVPSIYQSSNNDVSSHLRGIDALLSRYAEFSVTLTGGWVEDEYLIYFPVEQPFTLPENLVGSKFVVIADPSLLTSIEVYQGPALVGVIDVTGTTVGAVTDEAYFDGSQPLILRATSTAAFTVFAINLLADKVAP